MNDYDPADCLHRHIISDIVRGLVGILRGDDGRMYFQMLSHDLKALELQRLKAKAAKIPPKIRVFSFLMLMCFMLTYIVIIRISAMPTSTPLRLWCPGSMRNGESRSEATSAACDRKTIRFSLISMT